MKRLIATKDPTPGSKQHRLLLFHNAEEQDQSFQWTHFHKMNPKITNIYPKNKSLGPPATRNPRMPSHASDTRNLPCVNTFSLSPTGGGGGGQSQHGFKDSCASQGSTV